MGISLIRKQLYFKFQKGVSEEKIKLLYTSQVEVACYFTLILYVRVYFSIKHIVKFSAFIKLVFIINHDDLYRGNKNNLEFRNYLYPVL